VTDIRNSIVRNTTLLMGSQIVTWLSTFALMIFLPRYLGSVEYGRLYLAMSVAMMFQVLIDFGGAYLIPKEISRSPATAPSLIANSLGLRVGFAVIAILLMVSFSFIAGYPPEVRALVAILALAKLWEGPLAVIATSFQGFERMGYRSLTSITERVFLAGVGIAVLMYGGRSMAVAIVMVTATLLSCLLGLLFLKRLVARMPSVAWSEVLKLVRMGFPYLLMSAFAVIYYRLNTVMLSLLAPEPVVGWFGVAFRLFDALMFLPSIFAAALFPVLSRIAGQKEAVSATTQKSLEFILLIGVPIAVLTLTCASEIIDLLFGLGEYLQAVVILQALSPALLIVYVNFVLVAALVGMDRQKRWWVIALATIPLSLALNYLLITFFQSHEANGGIGSAVATTLTECFVLVSAIAFIPRSVFGRSPFSIPVRMLVAGVLMAVIIILVRRELDAWVPAVAAGFITYGLSLLILRVYRLSDLVSVRAAISPSGLRKIFVSQGGPGQ
jgi:O-antigen/teichoic acid export membrane protein